MKPTQIENFFGITYRTWQNWKKENRPVVNFFDKYDSLIAEFLEFNSIRDLENASFSIDPIFEDYVITVLKRDLRLDRSKISNLFFPGSEFITRHLKKIDSSNQIDLNVNNAKQKFIEFIKDTRISSILDTEIKRQEVINDIENKFSNIEVYLLLKYPNKFTGSNQN